MDYVSSTPIRANITREYDKRKYTTDKSGKIRFDFLFSDWMMIWFVCYYFLPIRHSTQFPFTRFIYAEFNPLLAFMLGAAENAFTLLFIMAHTGNIKMTAKYLAMMVFAKLIPIYLLWEYPFDWMRSTVVLIIVFGIYNIYLLANGTNMYEVYERTITSILTDQDKTPIYSFVNDVISYF